MQGFLRGDELPTYRQTRGWVTPFNYPEYAIIASQDELNFCSQLKHVQTLKVYIYIPLFRLQVRNGFGCMVLMRSKPWESPL